MKYLCICVSSSLPFPAGASPFVPTGGGEEHRWNYYPDRATRLAHLPLQVCCLIRLSEGVSSLFVLFPHYFVTLPGKVRLALPVKHRVQMSHPHPSTQVMSLTKLR